MSSEFYIVISSMGIERVTPNLDEVLETIDSEIDFATEAHDEIEKLSIADGEFYSPAGWHVYLEDEYEDTIYFLQIKKYSRETLERVDFSSEEKELFNAKYGTFEIKHKEEE